MPLDAIISGNEIPFKMGGKSGSKGLTWMRAKINTHICAIVSM